VAEKPWTIRCFRCSKELFREDDYSTFTYHCADCHDQLYPDDPTMHVPAEVVWEEGALAKRVDRRGFGTGAVLGTKYLPFMPLHDPAKAAAVSLGEGGTPLIRLRGIEHQVELRFGLSLRIFGKVEGANPTGSFKDRGSLVEAAKALELGLPEVILASTGNMAASIAAYSNRERRQGLGCHIVVPRTADATKLIQSVVHNASLYRVDGQFSLAVELAEAFFAREVARAAKGHRGRFYLGGDYCYRMEGEKSFSYEVVEQLRRRENDAPDAVIVPVGAGTNLSAIAKGFREMRDLDLGVRAMPRVFGVQPFANLTDPAAPDPSEARSRQTTIQQVDGDWRPQMLSRFKPEFGAVLVKNPLDGLKVIAALKETRGEVVGVVLGDAVDMRFNHEEHGFDTLSAKWDLGRFESLFVETSAATSLAALYKLADQSKLKEGETVVLDLTGDGLKDTWVVAKHRLQLPVEAAVREEQEMSSDLGPLIPTAPSKDGATHVDEKAVVALARQVDREIRSRGAA
jgi:threonine synthase